MPVPESGIPLFGTESLALHLDEDRTRAPDGMAPGIRKGELTAIGTALLADLPRHLRRSYHPQQLINPLSPRRTAP